MREAVLSMRSLRKGGRCRVEVEGKGDCRREQCGAVGRSKADHTRIKIEIMITPANPFLMRTGTCGPGPHVSNNRTIDQKQRRHIIAVLEYM